MTGNIILCGYWTGDVPDSPRYPEYGGDPWVVACVHVEEIGTTYVCCTEVLGVLVPIDDLADSRG